MATFLLWNVNNNPRADGLVVSLVRRHKVDIVLLIEYAFGASQLPGLLQPLNFVKKNSAERFAVLCSANHQLQKLPARLGRRAGLWRWTTPAGQTGQIALVHGFDRRNYDDSTRRVLFRRVADAVRSCEARDSSRRSIIVGDFNAHPFDSSVLDSDGLHAIGVKSIRSSNTRRVQGLANAPDFFYNPMWRAYGQEHSDAGAATHYWLGRRSYELAWHMLDQVVIRPEECANFPEDRLSIISRVGAVSLLGADGLPDRVTASDHLPLVFEWNL